MKRFVSTTLCLVAVTAIVLSTYFVSMHRQVDRARRNSLERLDLYERSFLSRINKFKHLPFVVAHDDTVLSMFESRAGYKQASIMLKAFQLRSGASVVFVMNDLGDTLASSNDGQSDSFVGKNYSFRSYFKKAMQGREGAMFAVDASTGMPGYFLSHPIFMGSKIVGAAVVKFELSELQDAWKSEHEFILASDPNGVIVLSSRRSWLYRTFQPLSAERLGAIRKSRLYNDNPLTPLTVSTGKSMGVKWIEIDGTRFLLSVVRLQRMAWELYSLVTWSEMVDESSRLSFIAFLLSLASATGLLFIRERHLKVHMERRLERSKRAWRIDKEREESHRLLADSIAHQIRNPIIGIGGNANLLKRKLPQDDVLEEHLETIIGCCNDLEQVVVAVREYIDLIPSTTKPFDVESLVANIQSEVEAKSKLPPGAAHWDIVIEPAMLSMDSTLFGKALYEILTNSLEAMDSDTIFIEIRGEWKSSSECTGESLIPSDKCYVLSVCDSGTGISEETFSHVMEPFFSTKPHSTGLGLSKAKRVLQIFHGNLSITSPVSDRDGCSTLVRLTLPLLDGMEIEQ